MKVLFITLYGPEGPSSRFRVWQYLPWLEQAGVEVRVSPLWSAFFYRRLYRRGNLMLKMLALALGILRRIMDLVRAPFYQVVFLQREAFPIGPPVFEWLIGKLNAQIIFDFDDAIFIPKTSAANQRWIFLKSGNKLATNIRLAKLVLAGNSYLAHYARQWHSNVEILPTPVDTDRFVPSPADKANPSVIIGWLGSRTTSGYLGLVENALARLQAEYQDAIHIRLVGADDFRFSKVTAEFLPWNIDTEVSLLQSFDIGIMPMPDDEWSRGKCGYKALQYLSVGIPAVCSNVGMNSEIIIDGENGFLISSEQEWYDRLKTLIDHPDLRRKMGLAGSVKVREGYSLAACAEKMIGHLKKFSRNHH